MNTMTRTFASRILTLCGLALALMAGPMAGPALAQTIHYDLTTTSVKLNTSVTYNTVMISVLIRNPIGPETDQP